jgi:hypothetical protein
MCVHGSGTGSKPDGPSGRQRSSRRRVSQVPRRVPCTANASWAYEEHDGKNRHGDGRPSNARWYASMSDNARLCDQLVADITELPDRGPPECSAPERSVSQKP